MRKNLREKAKNAIRMMALIPGQGLTLNPKELGFQFGKKRKNPVTLIAQN